MTGRLSELPLARIPPFSLEAEQAVLGGLMLSPNAWDAVADRLVENDFFRRDHQLIFRAIGDLAQKNQPRDAVTLGEWFDSNHLSAEVGGTRYVLEIAASTPSAANVVAYADIVREKSVLRQLIDAGHDIAGMAFNPDGRDSKEVVEFAEQQVFRIAETGARGRQGFVTAREATIDAFGLLQQRFENKGELIGLSSGFADIDKMTAGLQGGDLIIVAARPSMGKSSLATNIAEAVAIKEKRAVAIFSMEMSSSQLAMRLISSLGHVDQQTLRTGDLADADWPRINMAITLLADARIFIDDTPSLSPMDLRSRARRLKREHDLGLIVVDYMQLMVVPGNKENRATEISEISRSLKALARELNVPVIALSQLNRSVEQRTDKKPVMSDLRESGSIEQDADLIMFIYRDEYYNDASESKGIAEIIIAKQRNGPTGTVKLKWHGHWTKFSSLAVDNYEGRFE